MWWSQPKYINALNRCRRPTVWGCDWFLNSGDAYQSLMALLSKLKSLFGIGGGADDDRRTETTVTVEHDPDAVTDDEVDEPADTAESTTEPEPEPVDGDATADDTAHKEPAAEQSDDEATATTDEPTADAVTDESGSAVAVDDAEVESADNTESAATAESEADTDDGDGYSDAPLDSIKGIGPAYSERLHDAGITSIAELAESDAETVGDAINVSPKTVNNWIDRAGKK